MSNEELTCRTCLNDEAWHRKNNPVHPFNNGSLGAKNALPTRTRQERRDAAQRPDQGPQIPNIPTDPVLRIALINRGILTPADLEAAQEQLRQALQEVRPTWSVPEGANADSSTQAGKTSTEPSGEKVNPKLLPLRSPTPE